MVVVIYSNDDSMDIETAREDLSICYVGDKDGCAAAAASVAVLVVIIVAAPVVVVVASAAPA